MNVPISRRLYAVPDPAVAMDFDQIYQSYHRLVRSVVFRMVADSAVDDLVQETFVRAWKRMSDVRDEKALKPWICRIALNVTYDELRRRGRRLESEPPAIDPPAPESGSEVADLAKLALETLSVSHREVVVLVCFEGFTLEETADLTSVSIGTVKSRLHYAREKMAVFLRAAGVNL